MSLTEHEARTYMRKCIELARRTDGIVKRPCVGAIILSKDCAVVGEGYKHLIEYTNLIVHAERAALNNAGDFARGGTLITTLEPCTKGRNNRIFGSCCELIVDAGIRSVIIGRLDTSPTVQAERGVNYLKRKGVSVLKLMDFDAEIERDLMYRCQSISFNIPNCL